MIGFYPHRPDQWFAWAIEVECDPLIEGALYLAKTTARYVLHNQNSHTVSLADARRLLGRLLSKRPDADGLELLTQLQPPNLSP